MIEKKPVDYIEDELENLQEDTELLEEVENESTLLLKIVVSGFLICLTMAVIGSYWYFPFSQKVAGQWETDEGVNYQLTSQGDKFSLKTTTTTRGVSFLYKGKWHGVGPNQYEGRDIKVQVIIDKGNLSEEELAGFEKKSDIYKVVKSSDKELVVEYSDESAKQLLATETPGAYFRYTLTNFQNVGGKEALQWNSSYFSKELVYLYRKD